jgi:dCTP diphosphatase
MCIDWAQFHTPTNLMLALSGEAGELCEIFQWKSNMDNKVNFNLTELELTHVGEEISDVYIYTSRICEQCGIDLSISVKNYLTNNNINVRCKTGSWENDFSYSDVLEIFQNVHVNNENSTLLYSKFSNDPRRLTLLVQGNVGKAAIMFANKLSNENSYGLETWEYEEICELSDILSCIIVLLSLIANCFDKNLGSIINDKMKKNEAKYPVNLAKGSSKKYTEYQDTIKNTKLVSKSISIKDICINTVISIFSVSTGYFIRSKLYKK